MDIRELERGKMTGIGRYLRNFVTYASAARPDHRFFLYGNQHTDPPVGEGNIALRIVREGMTLWWDQVVLPALVRKDQVDVFLSPYIKGPGRASCPLVITIHDLLFLMFPEYSGWRQRPKNALFNKIARWVGGRASLILTDSEYSRRDIQRLLGLDGERIQVLPIGLDEAYRPVPDRVALERVWQRYGIAPPYIFYLGNFEPHKNVGALLAAFSALEEGLRFRYQLVLGGRPDEWQEELLRLAQSLGIEARTRFIGQVAEEDMPALYSGAEVFAFPSLYEGFGLPPLEAMACGTAVVASDRTSIPEVVGDAGCLVNPEDVEELAEALRAILKDEERRRELVRRGLARAELFRSADLCERQLALLEQTARVSVAPHR